MSNPAALSALAKGDLDNFHVASTPGGIESQEKAGQAMLVASSDIPKDMSPNREAFERVGFVFGKDVDALFVSAKLPPGWTRAATDHSMHSSILDEQGRERVSVFYKAAFYDRCADCYLTCRYGVTTLYDDLPRGEGLPKGQCAIVVTDGTKEIHRVGTYPRSDYTASETLRQSALAWLKENFPQWEDAMAYW